MRTRFLTVLTVSLALMNFACEKKQDEAPAEAAKPAPAIESPGNTMIMPETMEELEAVKDKISPEEYEEAKKRIEAIANKEKLLFSKWSPDQIEFYKAVKAYKTGKGGDLNKLADMYVKIPLDKRFNSAYPMPFDDKLMATPEEEKKNGTTFSPINASNRNRTHLFDKPPFVHHSFFDYHIMKPGEKKTIEVDAGGGGIVFVAANKSADGQEYDESLIQEFQKSVTFKINGTAVKKTSVSEAAPALAMRGVQTVWSFLNFLTDEKPSKRVQQWFSIPEKTEGVVEIELVLAAEASDKLKNASFNVSLYEFGFTTVRTYAVPKYVETGQEIKLVAKIEKNGELLKGFKVQDSSFYDFVKKSFIPIKFTEVSDGVFEAPFKVPFDGREYAERNDNQILYKLRAVRKGEKASLTRSNQNHIYYQSSYCKVNEVKSWEYKKGEGLYVTLDVDIKHFEPKGKLRAQIEIATKAGHSMAHAAFPATEVQVKKGDKWNPVLFIADRALLWPGSMMTQEALEKGEFKVMAQASVILESYKITTGETCYTYVWWDAPKKN